MIDQLELAIRDQIDTANEEKAVLDECRRFMFDGQAGLNFELSMTVCDVHSLWEQGGERGEQWLQRYVALWSPIHDELRKLNSRDRKGRAPLKAQIARLQNFGHFGHLMHGEAYEEAQARLDEIITAQFENRKASDAELEAALTDFWESVSERGALQETWQWTLQDCADVAILHATNKHEVIDDNKEFCAAYLRARLRVGDGKLQLTYAEHYGLGGGLIKRIAARGNIKIAA